MLRNGYGQRFSDPHVFRSLEPKEHFVCEIDAKLILWSAGVVVWSERAYS